jgi:hypothetical protein
VPSNIVRGAHKTWGVGIAKNFFDRYSTKKPSTHPGGTFVLFCERFISVAGGTAVKAGSLDWHIREALKAKLEVDRQIKPNRIIRRGTRRY